MKQLPLYLVFLALGYLLHLGIDNLRPAPLQMHCEFMEPEHLSSCRYCVFKEKL